MNRLSAVINRFYYWPLCSPAENEIPVIIHSPFATTVAIIEAGLISLSDRKKLPVYYDLSFGNLGTAARTG